MKMNKLGRTDISVSRICLGTMTFGEQNTETEGHDQLDLAEEHGVNFLDSAEMYSFPASAETYGRSEEVVGTWMKKKGNRDRMVIATKICGPGPRFAHIRDGDLKFNKTHIKKAVEDSLRRLQTDYIDLYQTHWPERAANYFGKLDYEHDDSDDQWTPYEETLDAMDEQVTAGNIRAFGVSNETPWGLAEHLRLAETKGLPRAVSIQNPYSLINRVFDVGHSEISIREDCGLLAYSPLSFGVLSGKYLNGQVPDGSRHQLFPDFMRYFMPNGVSATEAYVNLARKHGLVPAEMALAFVNSRRFLTSNIIGATSLEQLKSNLKSEDLSLSDEVLAEIQAIHLSNTNPAP